MKASVVTRLKGFFSQKLTDKFKPEVHVNCQNPVGGGCVLSSEH